MERLRIEQLQATPLFGAIRDDSVVRLIEDARDVRVERGGYFFREGDPGSSLFILQSGSVEVLQGHGGDAYVIHSLAAGDFFGEMSLLDLAPRSASVRAAEDCSALEISMAALYRIYEHDVEQFALLEMNMAREVSRRLRHAGETIEKLRRSTG